MSFIYKIRWFVFGLFLTTSVALACPGSCSHKMGMQGKGEMCQTKTCNVAGQGRMCAHKQMCNHKMGDGMKKMCDSKACDTAKQGKMCGNMQMCHKGDGKGKMCQTKQHCAYGQQGKSCSNKCHFLRNLKYTLKNLNLSKSDWSDVKLAIRSYKEDLKKLKITTPLKSIQGGKFDRKIFLSAHPLHKKMEAQADLLETVLLILNEKQKENFAMLMGASQYYNELHPNGGMQCNSCQSGDIKLRMKPLKP